MKKTLALVLVLSMMIVASGALAATPSKNTLKDTVVIVGYGLRAVIWTTGVPGEDAKAADLRKNVTNSAMNGSALDALPEEIRAQLPEGYTVVNELDSVKFDGSLSETEEIKLAIKFDTPYVPGTVIYLVAAIPGDTTEWFLMEGAVNEDGYVEVTFDKEFVAKAANNDFILMAVSEN